MEIIVKNSILFEQLTRTNRIYRTKHVPVNGDGNGKEDGKGNGQGSGNGQGDKHGDGFGAGYGKGRASLNGTGSGDIF